jgi:hypothetical protein
MKACVTSQGNMAVFLLVVLLVASLFACMTPLVIAWAADSGYPYMMEGRGKITTEFEGHKESSIVNATDYYYIYTEFSNPAEQPKDLVRVFYVVNVIDSYGYPQYVDANNYGNRTVAGHASSGYALLWNPLVPGNYTIKTFLVSSYDAPQALSSVATFHVNVDEKVDTLGEGESNNRLRVESINKADNSVTIAYDYCDEIIPYMHSTKAALHPGEHVSINSVDAYLADIRGGNATFRFVSNGGSDFCLL